MKRKCMMVAGIMAAMLAVATGCGNGQKSENEDSLIPVEEDAGEQNQSDGAEHNDSGALDSNNRNAAGGNNGDEAVPESNSIDISDVSPDGGDNSRDTEIIGGKVRSIAQDSFVISRTLVEDSFVIMPEPGSPEEELVNIQCTDATLFEHWTIQGGGAGIETKEADFSDITEGGGLEAEGYFDGEEFVAEKVIIEVYK